jgi:hypothetical protein
MVIFHSYVNYQRVYVSHLMFQQLSPTHSRCRSQPPLTCSGGYSLRPPNRPGPSGPKANSHLGWWVVMGENPQCQTFKRGWKTWPKWWTKKTWSLDWENQRNPEISRGYMVYPTSRLADQKNCGHRLLGRLWGFLQVPLLSCCQFNMAICTLWLN